MADTVNPIAGIVTDQQRAVVRNRYTGGAAPNTFLVDNETHQEIFVLAGGNAVLHQHPHDLVAVRKERFQEPCSAAKPSPWWLLGNTEEPRFAV